jgi:hypothetical protein
MPKCRTLGRSGSLGVAQKTFCAGFNYGENDMPKNSHIAIRRRYHVANCVGLFLMEEDAGPLLRTLRIGVGGYYEAFTVSQGTLTPIGDCITIFADIIGRNRDRTVSIRRLLYHCYRSQHLYVFSVLQEVVISAASPAKIPLTACKLFDVPVIEPEVELSPWTIHRVASQMSGAKNIRTVMRKEIAGQPATKRFMTNTRDHQLVKVTLSGDHLVISLDEAALQYFASRFPPNLADAIMV